MVNYLVFFVVDDVSDALAGEVRRYVQALARSRPWPHAPGYFDDPEPAEGSPRTTGGFLRVEGDTADGDDARVFCAAVQELSQRAIVDVELQWREEILGRVRAGVPDEGLEEALKLVTGEGIRRSGEDDRE